MSAVVQESDGAEPAFVQPLYEFTSRLMVSLTSAGQPANLIASPISIHKALNMVLLGADANSTTERELLDTIGYSSLDDAGIQKCHEDYGKVLDEFKRVTQTSLARMKPERAEGESEEDFVMRTRFERNGPLLDMFNMLITKNRAQLLPEYRDRVGRFYHGSVDNVEDARPETKAQIMERLNGWGKEAGFEQPIMTPLELNGDFDAILLSAVRVQSYWFDKFREFTDAKIFYTHGLQDKPVSGKALALDDVKGAKYLELADASRAQHKQLNERLSSSSATFRELSSLNAQVVQVPLEGGLTYTIFEPLEFSTPDDNKLQRLAGQLFAANNTDASTSKLAKILHMLDGAEGHVSGALDLSMPKFKFEQEIKLVGVLKSMGIRRAFDREGAEISRMTTEKLCVSDARHQAVIEVNESGLKAAGVTKIRAMALAAFRHVEPPLEVSITRPFVFLIRYASVPLFVGQLSSL